MQSKVNMMEFPSLPVKVARSPFFPPPPLIAARAQEILPVVGKTGGDGTLLTMLADKMVFHRTGVNKQARKLAKQKKTAVVKAQPVSAGGCVFTFSVVPPAVAVAVAAAAAAPALPVAAPAPVRSVAPVAVPAVARGVPVAPVRSVAPVAAPAVARGVPVVRPAVAPTAPKLAPIACVPAVAPAQPTGCRNGCAAPRPRLSGVERCSLAVLATNPYFPLVIAEQSKEFHNAIVKEQIAALSKVMLLLAPRSKNKN